MTPIARVLGSEWEELGLRDEDTLQTYLEQNLEPGRYLLEPQNAQNKRLDGANIASWTMTVGDDMEMTMQDGSSHSMRGGHSPRRGGRPRRHRFTEDVDYDPDDGDDFDDPIGERTNIADFLTATAEGVTREREIAAEERREQRQIEAQERDMETRRSTDMMSLMMMMSEKSREDQKRADEQREARMAEERRQERDREERRKEEREREWRERRDEERRREEAQRERDRLLMETQSKRTETLITVVSAALSSPMIPKLFERKDSPVMEALLANINKKPETDPMMMLLLKNMLDKNNSNDSMQQMVAMMGEMSRQSSSMMIEQMKASFMSMNEFQQEQMKRVMQMALANPDIEDDKKSLLEQVLGAIGGIGEVFQNIRGQQPQQPQLPPGAVPPQQPMQPMQPMQPIGMPPMQPGMQPPPVDPGGIPLGPNPQEVAIEAPTGIQAVGAGLKAIQQNAFSSEEEKRQVIEYMLDQMPDDLAIAIEDGDEEQVFAICTPAFAATPELLQWIAIPEVQQWVRDFLPNLVPAIQQMRSPISEQPQDEGAEPEPEAGDEADDGSAEDDDGPV